MVEEKSTDSSKPDWSVIRKVTSFFSRRQKSEGEEKLAKHEEKKDLDKQLVLAVSGKRRHFVPSWAQLQQITRLLSPKESRLIKASLLVILLALIFFGGNFWFSVLKLKPAYGGEYSEGLLGNLKYINPLFATSNDVDLDVSTLVFSSLLKHGPSGLENDLAESYAVSADQKQYTFTLRHGVKWQDSDQEVTANDVLFTFDLIKDPEVASPLAVSFKGITAEKVDDYTIKFALKEPFAPFLGTLTFGILPEYLWSAVDPLNIKLVELNLKPIGSGPFQFDSLKKDKQGAVRTLTLASNKNYYGGRPYLDKVTFKFYPDTDSLEQAVINKNVLAVSYLPTESKAKIFGAETSAKGFNLHFLELPQYSAVFFNQQANSILKDKSARQALYEAVDRQRIVREVLSGQAEVVNGPILKGLVGYNADIGKYDYAPTDAAKILDGLKWQAITPNQFIAKQRELEKKNTPAGQEFVDRADAERLAEIAGQEYFRQKGDIILEITLTVVDQPESVSVAKIIKENWQAVGVRANINIVSAESIRREVIRPRDYQALIYSEITGVDPDPYPFWHSSQVNDPGLNLAMFADKRADRYIEVARQTSDVAVRADNYKKFEELLASEIPAIFLYSPTYTYIVSDKVKGLAIDRIFNPADRLLDMSKRYLEEKRGW